MVAELEAAQRLVADDNHQVRPDHQRQPNQPERIPAAAANQRIEIHAQERHQHRRNQVERRAVIRIKRQRLTSPLIFRQAHQLLQMLPRVRQRKLSVLRQLKFRQVGVPKFQRIAEAQVVQHHVARGNQRRGQQIRHLPLPAMPHAAFVEQMHQQRKIQRRHRSAPNCARPPRQRPAASAALRRIYRHQRKREAHRLRQEPHPALQGNEQIPVRQIQVQHIPRRIVRAARHPPINPQRIGNAKQRHRQIDEVIRRIQPENRRERQHHIRRKQRKTHIELAAVLRQFQPCEIRVDIQMSFQPRARLNGVRAIRVVRRQKASRERAHHQQDNQDDERIQRIFRRKRPQTMPCAFRNGLHRDDPPLLVLFADKTQF